MRHNKLLLLVFLLTLFVFQQVQAGATMPPKEDPSQNSLAPVYAPLPTHHRSFCVVVRSYNQRNL